MFLEKNLPQSWKRLFAECSPKGTRVCHDLAGDMILKDLSNVTNQNRAARVIGLCDEYGSLYYCP